MNRTLLFITQCATNDFSILLSLCVNLLVSYKWDFRWFISKIECKSYSIANVENWILLNLSTIASFVLFNLQKMSHSNRISLFTLSYNSIRHWRFFDIIKFICKAITELQIKFSLIYFKNWVQKLFNCKDWKI